MLLNRLECGFLLYETPHGLVRVEVPFKQRLHLLWTFRNFHQLSVPLLTSREQELVNAMFLGKGTIVSDSINRLPALGVVESYVPTNSTKTLPEFDFVPAATSLRSAGLEVASPAFAVSRFAWSKSFTAAAVLLFCGTCTVGWLRLQGSPVFSVQAEQTAMPVNADAREAVANSGFANTTAAAEAVSTTPNGSEQPILAPTVKNSDATSDSEVIPQSAENTVPARAAAEQASATPATIPVVKSRPVNNNPALSSARDAGGMDTTIPASRPPLSFVYPVAPDSHAQGEVALRASVDAEGAVRAVKVVSGNRVLAAAAVRAVRQWHYRPYLQDGQTVPTETNVVISFIANEAISMSFPPTFGSNR